MMWPFSKKPQNNEYKLVFKDSAAFFKLQCKYGQTKIVKNQGIIAIILDASKEFGAEVAVKIEPDGSQLVMLKVASDDGGFIVPSRTPLPIGENLKPGDLVIWVPVEYMEMSRAVDETIDSRFGWTGFVVAKVKPEFDPQNTSFEIVCRYDK